MKRNWIRKILGGLSFTTALFVFQACYGTPQDFGFDLLIEGQVKSKATGKPIKGLKVSVAEMMQYEYTNEEGKFSFYTARTDSVLLKFEDIDLTQNGSFIDRDTIITSINDKIYLDIVMEEK